MPRRATVSRPCRRAVVDGGGVKKLCRQANGGSGRRLFNDGVLPATMRPVDVTVTDLGIVVGTYEPAGSVRHGEM